MSSQSTSSGANYFIFNIEILLSGGIHYNAVPIRGGKNFMPGQSFSVLGSLLGGADGTNNFNATITRTSTAGEILDITATGTPIGLSSPAVYGPFYVYPVQDVTYIRNKATIRDASDWISAKKQVLLAQTAERGRTRQLIGPKGEENSNGFRLTVKEGLLKQHMFSCTGCFGGAFNGT